jgi:putative ABC transport system permease protein
MPSIWAAGFLLRRLRAESGVVALLVVLVAVTSFLFAAAPRLFNLVADAALVDQLRAAGVADRDIQLTSTAVPPNGADPLGQIDLTGEQFHQAFPSSIGSLIGAQHYSITSPRFTIPEPPRYRTYVSLLYQDGLEDAIRLVAGRLPAANGEPLPLATLDFGNEPPPLPTTPPRIEIAISEATAAEIGADIGTTMGATLDGADPILRSFVIRRIDAEFKVVGIFAIVDPEADIWYADRHLQRPDIGGSLEFPIAYATGLVAPEAVHDLTTSSLPFRLAWRFYLAPERIDVGQLDTVIPELERIQSVSADNTFGGFLGFPLAMRTGLLSIIGGYLAERSASEAVLTVAGIGPFSLAVGAIAMVAILLVARRRSSLELARGRGASGLLILASQLWEATILAGGAALVGLLVAVWIVPGRSAQLSVWVALATGAAATLAMEFATLPAIRRRIGGAGREDAAVLPTSPRRLVLEFTAVGLAVAGVLLLQQRGLVIGTGRVGEIVRLDPFLAAVPVLAGAAMGIVAMRLYPLPIRALGWLAARRRDLVPVLGLRSVGRHSAAANLPLLVLMLTAAFGAFASVVLSSVDRGQVQSAWAEVGADYRVELAGGNEGGARDLAAVPGVRAVAAAYLDQAATFADQPAQRSQVVLDAVDLDAYTAVVAGSPIDLSWPSGFNTPQDGTQPGSPESPIPAIVSEQVPSGSGPLSPGDPFTVEVGIHRLSFVVVDRRASFPGIRPDAAFVVVSLETLQRAQTEAPLLPSVIFVSGPADIADALTTVASDNGSSAVLSRFDRYASLRQAPLIAMVTSGFRIALLVAVFYAGFAIVGALTLTAARRGQDLAFLRTLGLSAGQATGLTVLEQGPPVVLALIPGVALGIWIAVLLATGLGLSAFIGAEGTLTIDVNWAEIALVGGALVMMVTIAGIASTWLARRAQAIDALRLGGD